jgi:hypothetical protein
LHLSTKEEVGSAGEQPASNKVDAITINKKETMKTVSFLFIG